MSWVPVNNVMNTFDAPVTAVDGQDALRRGLVRGTTGNPERGLTPELARFFLDRFAFDQKHLTGVGKVEVSVERRTAPNAPRLDATMLSQCRLDEIGDAAPFKQHPDIALQRRLVSLGSEVIMPLSFNNIVGQSALGEQRIARNVLAGDVTALKQRDRHANLVGALLLITALYRQCAYFFWA